MFAKPPLCSKTTFRFCLLVCGFYLLGCQPRAASKPADLPTAKHSREAPLSNAPAPSDASAKVSDNSRSNTTLVQGPSFPPMAALLEQAEKEVSGESTQERAIPYEPPREPEIPQDRLEKAGLRVLRSDRLVLYTDLPQSANVDAMPAVFDQAFPQWAEFFDVDVRQFTSWRVVGMLMRERRSFEAVGLYPPELPEFKNAFTRYDHFWAYEQSSDYYLRHLMLHEGAHAFMQTLKPHFERPWAQEGLAELLGTHRWENNKLTLNWFPDQPLSVSGLGRIELIQKAYQQNQALAIQDVLQFNNRAHLQVEPYAWCWALCAFLQGEAATKQAFLEWAHGNNLASQAALERLLLKQESNEISDAWQVFIADLDHGFDFSRNQLDFSSGETLEQSRQLKVEAGKGWQNSGVRLKKGSTYQFQAQGRFQVAADPQPWISEPAGVTLEYYRGRPLGELHGIVRLAENERKGKTGWSAPFLIGAGTEFHATESGVLYLKINDSAGKLADNSGNIEVTIEPNRETTTE